VPSKVKRKSRLPAKEGSNSRLSSLSRKEDPVASIEGEGEGRRRSYRFPLGNSKNACETAAQALHKKD